MPEDVTSGTVPRMWGQTVIALLEFFIPRLKLLLRGVQIHGPDCCRQVAYIHDAILHTHMKALR